jgi:PAS domain S-box-containing protein
LIDNTLVGLLQVSLAGEILFANQAALKIFGFQSQEELQAAGGMSARYQDESDREALIARLRADGRVEHYEVALTRKDGTPVLVDSSIVIDEGRLSGVLIDVTDRRRLEEEALRSQKLDSLGLLAGGLAHDFNNFLSAVLSNVSLARHHTSADERTQEWLEEAERACQRAAGLTEQLLTFAKGGAPSLRVLALGPLIEEAVGFGLRGSNVAADLSLPADLPLVEGDEGQLAQVIHNLVINAVQAMPRGGTLRVRAEADGLDVRVCFQDEGAGIPPAEREAVFLPYYSTKPTGRGLGLSAAHSIVSRHGGALVVEGAASGGACFVIELPAAAEQVLNLPEQTPASPTPTGGLGARVLVMDDEEVIRSTTAAILEGLGYAPTTVPDGEAALAAYAERPYDVVLLDLTIKGGLGGLATLERLRGLDPAVCAVVVSGYANAPVLSRYAEFGFADRLRKPFTMEELGASLRRCLRGSATRA